MSRENRYYIFGQEPHEIKKQVANLLIDKFGHDVPHNFEGLFHICLREYITCQNSTTEAEQVFLLALAKEFKSDFSSLKQSNNNTPASV